jgi:predicted transcriptional regulator
MTDLNQTDKLILTKLTEGRCTPGYLAEELSKSQSYISQRLRRLRDGEYVVRVDRGLYEHVNYQNRYVRPKEKLNSIIEPDSTILLQEEDSTETDSSKGEISITLDDPSDSADDRITDRPRERVERRPREATVEFLDEDSDDKNLSR